MEHLLTQPHPSIPAAAHCRVFKDPGSEVKPGSVRGHSVSQHSGSRAYFTAFRSTARQWCERDIIKGNNAGKQSYPIIASYSDDAKKIKVRGEEFWPYGINSFQWARQNRLLNGAYIVAWMLAVLLVSLQVSNKEQLQWEEVSSNPKWTSWIFCSSWRRQILALLFVLTQWPC